jgi:hypothetical protein
LLCHDEVLSSEGTSSTISLSYQYNFVTNITFCIDRRNLPRLAGKVPNVTKFDASFFGIDYKQAHIMDPMCRLLLERTYEALVDAG